ncbi:hypothetical protein [Phytohabitans kaempferiae]|uniref:HTH myb-type domain-containing protein n=1 Tax=Phytohabitans kaempferiae TaxID=1620943 RepID=A0ABV6MAS9_9ACTN
MTAELTDLAEVAAARARLDEHERELIERARHHGATWHQIAAVLGLASRQAAQQRHQRLVESARARRRALDLAYAPGLAAVRAAVVALDRWIEADQGWDAHFTRADLVRQTVRAALDAGPGSLYALAVHIAADLSGAGEQRLPLPVRQALAELRQALSTED